MTILNEDQETALWALYEHFMGEDQDLIENYLPYLRHIARALLVPSEEFYSMTGHFLNEQEEVLNVQDPYYMLRLLRRELE